jgi:hypothetical protein
MRFRLQWMRNLGLLKVGLRSTPMALPAVARRPDEIQRRVGLSIPRF